MIKILLVEDDKIIVASLSEYLNSEGYLVRSVSGQTAAMKLLAEEKVDLVLLDVSLAEGNGFAACRAIKSEFIVLPLEKPCNIRRFRLSNPQTACTFPCFFPYGLKQGKDFYSPLTTLSSSRAELRFASLVEWA